LAPLALAIFVFIKTSSQFGASSDENSKMLIDNLKNFVNGKFVNLHPVTVGAVGATTILFVQVLK